MPAITANGIEIFYDECGEASDPAVLLIMGFTAQMVSWDDDFCAELASRGFRVVRFDNRDVGLSHKTPGEPPALGSGEPPPYTLSDMAADAVGVLDVLGIDKAHIVGASMGGMIAQRVALHHAERVLSLTSIMSTTGDPTVGTPTPEAMQALMQRPPADRDGFIEHSLKTGQVIQGPLWTEERARRRAAMFYDRSYHPVGAAFQLAAIMADGDRTQALATIACPTLVIHGAVDRLITPSGGEATAEAIPGAELLVLDEMGHDLPPKLWPIVADAIAEVASRASAVASANTEA